MIPRGKLICAAKKNLDGLYCMATSLIYLHVGTYGSCSTQHILYCPLRETCPRFNIAPSHYHLLIAHG